MKPRSCAQRHLLKTKMCRLEKEGRCHYGEKCFYAHSEIELRDAPNLVKTSICKGSQDGSCALGHHCTFAHSTKELRECSKRIPCKWFLEGYCSHGTSCRFLHSCSSNSETDCPTPCSVDLSEAVQVESLLDLLTFLASQREPDWSLM